MPDTIRSAENPRTSERRLHRRQHALFSCVQLEDDNGGIILDISEGGLAMQAVRSLADGQLPTMRFEFSESQPWIETRGRIAWISASKNTIGMEFVGLPEKARNQIRQWISLTPHPSGSSEENCLGEQIEPVKDVLPTWEPESALFVPKTETTVCVVANQGRHSIEEDSVGFLSIAKIPDVATVVRDSKHIKQNLAIMVFLAAVAAIGILSFAYNGGIREPLIRLRERISADSHHRSTAAGTMPMPRSGAESVTSAGDMTRGKAELHNSLVPAASGSSAGPSPESDANGPSTEIGDSQIQPAFGQTAETTAVAGAAKRRRKNSDSATSAIPVSKKDANSQAELVLARRYLRDTSRSEHRVEAVKLLWSAIGKGNADAELQLADLYLRGEDVPRNCEQARILIRAAHNGRDAAIPPDLQELSDNDCK